MASPPTCSSNGEEEKLHQVPAAGRCRGGGGVVVSNCLYLKSPPDAERRSLDRDAVLRQIRHRKRMGQFRAALGWPPLGRLQPEAVAGAANKDAERDGQWLDVDAFSFP